MKKSRPVDRRPGLPPLNGPVVQAGPETRQLLAFLLGIPGTYKVRGRTVKLEADGMATVIDHAAK